MYGESCGTSTLAKSLMRTSAELYYNMDDGVPWEQLRDDARKMVEGSIVLWKTILEEAANERSRADGR